MSDVWQYFVKENGKGAVKCKICQSELKFTGSTSTLRYHINKKHSSAICGLSPNIASYFERSVSQDEAATSNPDSTPLTSRPSTSCVPEDVEEHRSKQPRIDSVFQSSSTTKTKHELYTQAIAKMVAEDMLPISFVEGKGFKSFMKVVSPYYLVPSRNTIHSRIVLLYNQQKAKVMDQLNRLEYIALTTDCWSSNANESYVTVTAHGITNDFTMVSYTLSTEEMQERHTSQNLKEKLENIISEWGMQDKIIATVHDNAANITNAVKREESFGISVKCLAHSLQLALNRGLDDNTEIKNVISRCSQLVGHFKHSNNACKALESSQVQMSYAKHKLITAVKTRWNSTFKMLKRLEEQRQPILAVLNDRNITSRKCAQDLEISEAQWHLIEEINKILEPFDVATAFISSENNPTASVTYPLVFSLVTNYLCPNSGDSPDIKLFKELVKSDLTSRYNIQGHSVGFRYDEACILDKATFMDPRYKNQERKLGISQKVKADLQPELVSLPTISNREIQIERQTAISILFPDAHSVEDDELQNYAIERELNRSSDVLRWWRSGRDRYPRLSKLAKKYLCIPATSTPSETVFSTAGNIINRKGSCLLPENVNMLVFLSQNKHCV